MQKLNDYIEEKKIKSSKTPRYGMKKLAVGLVSCILGYTVLVSPGVVHAEEVTEPQAVVMEAEEEVKEEAVLPEETEEGEEEAVEEQEEVVEEENALEVSEEEEKEAVTAAETKEEIESLGEKEEKTEETAEEETEKKLVTLDEYKALQEEENGEDGINIEDAELVSNVLGGVANDKTVDEIEVGDETKPESQTAGENQSTEAVIENVEITIGGAVNGDKTDTVNPTALPNRIKEGTTDINLEAQVDFDIPEGTKSGRTFDFVVSDNVNLHGVLESKTVGEPVIFDGEEIATAEKLTDGRKGYKYTFNEKVNNLKDIRVRIIYPLFIDPDKVPMGTKEYEIGEDGKYVLDGEGNPVLKADNKEKVSVTVAGKTASKDYTVEYESGVFEEKRTGPTLSGIADIDKVTDNNYNHTIYVNPTADQMLNGSHVTVQNEKGYNTVTFDEDVKKTVKVYKVKDPNKLPLSFGNNFGDGNYEDVTDKANVKLEKDGNNADLNKLVIDVNQGNTNNSMPFDDKDFDSSSYVITYTGKRTTNKAFKTNTIFTADWRKADRNVEDLSQSGDHSWAWTNEIVIDDAEAIALANKTYSLGDRVWIDTDEDGSQGDKETGLEGVKVILKGINMSDKETITDANGNYKFERLRNGEYTVEFEIPAGYAPTEANKDGVTEDKDSDASKDTTNNKIAIATGTIEGADNMNVDFGVVKSNEGTFTEEHIYKTLDFDGKVVETSDPEQGEHKEGNKDVQYTTKAKEKEGFKLVSVEANDTDAVIDSENGTAKTGNIVEGKDLKVTYTYEKQPGRFVEHHIYKTVDKEGNVLTTDKTVNLPEDGQNPFEGYSSEAVNTKQRAEEGYTFKEATDIKLQNDDSEKTYTNYVPGKVLEKTYIYTKTQEEPEEKTYSLGDRVWVDDNKDGLQTEGEKGLKDVTVKLTGGDLTEEKTTITDANGNYKFEGLKNGEYKVTFVKPDGYEITKTNEGTNDEKDSDGAEVTATIKDANNMSIDLGLVKKEDPTPEPTKPEQPKEEEPKEEEQPNPTPDPTPTPEETPVEEPKEDPAPKEEPKTEEPKEEETPEETPVEEPKEEEKEVVIEKEEDDEADRSKDTTPKHEGKEDYSKAPQTGVAGAAGYLGLAGLGTALLAALEDKKKKKNK